VSSLAERLASRIRRHGPIGFDEFVEAALYDPEDGFFERGGRAGRRGDFLTSPEVGPLFGAVVAAALDRWWAELGRPDPFVVVDAGAGPGTLARSVLAAAPACSPALRYVLVERSTAQRAAHAEHLPLEPPSWAFGPPAAEAEDTDAGPAVAEGRGPIAVSLAELPATPFVGVVLANELLDDLPVLLLHRTAEGWEEIRVGVQGDAFVEVTVPVSPALAARADALAPDAEPGARLPIQGAAAAWVRDVLERLEAGRLVVLDYMDTTAGLAARPWPTWLRTYRAHGRGGHPLEEPGSQDITCEVAHDQLAPGRPVARTTQADWLRAHGLDALVEEGKRIWRERAALGDLAALRARSRVQEAEALTDPDGLGGFTVLEWAV